MKRKLIIGAVISAAVIIGTCLYLIKSNYSDPKNKSSNENISWQTYLSYGGDFSIDYPVYWDAKFTQPVADELQGVNFTDKNNPFARSVNVSFVLETGPPNSRAVMHSKENIIEEVNTTINGKPAYKEVYISENNVKVHKAYVSNGNSLITISMSQQNSDQELENIYDEMLSSVKFVK